jgi:hypothetical protein
MRPWQRRRLFSPQRHREMSKPDKLRDLRTVAVAIPPKGVRRVAKPVRPVASLPQPVAASRSVRLTRILDSLPARAVRRLALRVVANIAELTLYGGIAVAIGLTTAWYMVDYGSRLTVERDGPWQRWTIAGAPGADPYTKAHFSRAGWLPMSTVAAHYHIASKDSAGEALYTDCDYLVSGPVPVGRRWTLAAFDLAGHVIAAGAGQSVIASTYALPGQDGLVAVRLSQSTSPGNWLGLSGSSRMQLVLMVYGRNDKAVRAAVAANAATRRPLPSIMRTGCR